ncbi:hypothetical protein [Methanolapillus africanus]
MNNYLNKIISLRTLMLNCCHGIAYSIDIDNDIEQHNVFAFDINTINPEYLPTEDSFYEFEIREYPTQAKKTKVHEYSQNKSENVQIKETNEKYDQDSENDKK